MELVQELGAFISAERHHLDSSRFFCGFKCQNDWGCVLTYPDDVVAELRSRSLKELNDFLGDAGLKIDFLGLPRAAPALLLDAPSSSGETKVSAASCESL